MLYFKGIIMKLSSHVVLLLLTFQITAFASEGITRPPLTENLEWKGRIVVEFAEELGAITVQNTDGVALLGENNLDALARQYGIFQITKFFRNSSEPADPSIRDLSRYYILEFPLEIDLQEVVNAYGDNPLIITADPYYVRKQCYIPDDPYWTNQWYMSQVDADVAFDYCTGDNRVIIGVVDSGIDTTHDDLRDNLWINPGEDLNGNGIIDPLEWNGIDDDANGYTDDFWGWNTWIWTNDVQDNDPQGGHGTHCSGDAAAVTDNGVGISSLGYQCKIMTARAGDGEYVYAGTQGITYCADNGVNVITLSYGNNQFWGPENAAIQNAWGQGVLIFAAAGNENTSTLHYPSAYDNVIAVAATNQNDGKAYFSNYGDWVDISAPGMEIYSTWPINNYELAQGTSMACPIAAGLGCLVWAAKPGWTNAQVAQHIFDTCFNIDAINPSYIGQLGYGRIDAGTAISILYPNLYYTQQEFDDTAGNGDGRPDPGETVDFLITIENQSITMGAVNVEVTFECTDPGIVISNGYINLGDIAAGASANNHSDPFIFSVDPLAEPHIVTFTLTRVENGMGLEQIEEINQWIGRPEYIIVDDDGGANFEDWYIQDMDSLELTYEHWDVTSVGELSSEEIINYSIVIWFTSNEDDPLTQSEQSSIEEHLNNGGYLLLSGEDIDEQLAGTDFYANALYALSTSSSGALLLTGMDGDPVSDSDTLYLSVGSGGAPNNNDPSTIEPLSPAELIYEYSNDLGAGIRWSQEGGGMLVYLPFCFEAVTGALNSTARTEVLTDVFAWFDSNQPSVVEPNKPHELPVEFSLGQNYPNPFNPSTEIEFSLPVAGYVKLSVFDLTGKNITALVDRSLEAGYHRVVFNGEGLASGIYLYRLEAGGNAITNKMILLK
ncbi:hypothetical protein CEE37_12465 [candidate division LCP-89 bacterium B3_LCP]|uniref:Peptidase S8/S53 domain-containing protein n=1 Tax=candidate division LCP-89 bacterium B3_LCP TaxID=2012998 RepID=A0A532UUF2_UNCL8|nr:MAG: hypothetical protein CEE37_12465 [candidate division LCP-89 bacterium B3_LCP]